MMRLATLHGAIDHLSARAVFASPPPAPFLCGSFVGHRATVLRRSRMCVLRARPRRSGRRRLRAAQSFGLLGSQPRRHNREIEFDLRSSATRSVSETMPAPGRIERLHHGCSSARESEPCSSWRAGVDHSLHRRAGPSARVRERVTRSACGTEGAQTEDAFARRLARAP